MRAARRWTVTVHRLVTCTSPPTTKLDTTYKIKATLNIHKELSILFVSCNMELKNGCGRHTISQAFVGNFLMTHVGIKIHTSSRTHKSKDI